MADDRPSGLGSWLVRSQWGQEMRREGAWASRWSPPTIDDYQRFRLRETENSVMAEDIHANWQTFRTAIETHQRQVEVLREAVAMGQEMMENDHPWMLECFGQDMADIREHFAHSMEDILESIREQVDDLDPDALAWAEREPLSAAHVDNWEESLEARHDRDYDEWEMSDAGIAAQEREIAQFGARHPFDELVVDTTYNGSDADFQALLARLDQRLEQLVEMTHHQEQSLTQRYGMEY